MAKYKNLVVWQKANLLALKVYKLTEDFPKKETFAITSQLKRSALSIPTNIVEAMGAKVKQNFLALLTYQSALLQKLSILLNFQKSLAILKLTLLK